MLFGAVFFHIELLNSSTLGHRLQSDLAFQAVFFPIDGYDDLAAEVAAQRIRYGCLSGKNAPPKSRNKEKSFPLTMVNYFIAPDTFLV